MTVSYQPWYQGCTYPVWDIPLTTDSGAENIAGFDMTKFSITFHLSSGGDIIGTGSFSMKTATPAEVYYQPSDADVMSPFTCTLFIKAVTPDGRHIVYDPITPFVITSS